MDYITILGYSAGIFGSIPMLPQIYKSYTSKSTKDISNIFLIFSILSSILWVIYGYLIYDTPLLICSLTYLLLNIYLYCMKIYYDNYYTVE
jgi:MtN3 and saliva related transmembrane protein